jgi:hypothetical protein
MSGAVDGRKNPMVTQVGKYLMDNRLTVLARIAEDAGWPNKTKRISNLKSYIQRKIFPELGIEIKRKPYARRGAKLPDSVIFDGTDYVHKETAVGFDKMPFACTSKSELLAKLASKKKRARSDKALVVLGNPAPSVPGGEAEEESEEEDSDSEAEEESEEEDSDSEAEEVDDEGDDDNDIF